MLESFYSLFCHQQLSRSLIISGQALPLCARCTGIYLGFLISLISCLMVLGEKSTKLVFSRSGMITSVGMVFVFITEAIAERLGCLELSNNMRFLAAMFAGVSIAYILLFLSGSEQNNRLCGNLSSDVLLKALPVICLLLLVGFSSSRFEGLLRVYKTLPLFGIISLYLMLNGNVARLIFGLKNKKYVIGSSLLLLGVELLFLKVLHN